MIKVLSSLSQILVLVSGTSDPLLDFAGRLSKESPGQDDNVTKILQSLDKDQIMKTAQQNDEINGKFLDQDQDLPTEE